MGRGPARIFYALPGRSCSTRAPPEYDLDVLGTEPRVDIALLLGRWEDGANRQPAEYFGPLGEFGTVEVGKRADLILLNASPLRNIDAVFDQAGVMLRGAWLPRSVLDDAATRHAAALF